MTNAAQPQPPAKRQPGRPRAINQGQGGFSRHLYIDAANYEIALKIGNGNMSEGIRIALQMVAENLKMRP